MTDRIRRIAVFIDGGFFLKRLPKLDIPDHYRNSPESVARTAYELCKRHVLRLVGNECREDGRWLDHAYRFFYYDAVPYGKQAHHPLCNRPTDFGKTPEARFRLELFDHLRRKRKFAVRLGHVDKTGGWRLRDEKKFKHLLKTVQLTDLLARLGNGESILPDDLSDEQRAVIQLLARKLRDIQEDDLVLELRQKGVDMRLGIDITSIVLKKQADTLVLVTGDSDFVPVAKLARREGAEVILDPMWQAIRASLHEHIDGLYSVLGNEADRAEHRPLQD